jgi:hypothetical protein
MNDSPVARAETPRITISAEERARRRAAYEYAYTSARLEGFEPSEFARALHRRYIDGEITREELGATIRAHHGV